MNTLTLIPSRFRLHTLSAALLWGLALNAHAQLNLLREPANARVSEPAPNVILSLDDSGSMGWDLEGCATMDWRVDVYGEFNEAGAVNCPGRAWNTRPSRMRILRGALIDTFGNPLTGTKGIIEDNRIRLAWQSMWDNARTSRPSHLQNWQDRIDPGQPNAIRPFSGAHRQNFHTFVSTLSPVYGTPSHKMMGNVHSYMGTPLSINSPFASNPGVVAQPYLACRRSFHIFMTDGAWNSETGAVGNVDGSSFNFPDGTAFGNSNQTRLYRDSWGGSIGTLADWSLRNWGTDFQPSIPNQIKPLIKVPGTEASTGLQEYWNPKNNPMTWQGVTQYAIGFGTSATRWAGRPTWGGDTHSGADYLNLINGNVSWADVFSGGESARPMDLWHMALNGRGKYYQARTESDLRVAFNDILEDILAATASPLAASAGSNIKLGLGGLAFLSAYDGARWKGELRALRVGAQGSVDGVAWDAGQLLDNRNLASRPRRILSHNGSNAIVFDWASLNDNQRNALRGGDSETIAQQRMNYLRGDRSLEQPAGNMRQRDSRLGSLVNSAPMLMPPPSVMAANHKGRDTFIRDQRQRRPVLFVGSNGGMLHAFDAGTGNGAGQELFAYVPLGVYSKLRDYTLPSYEHQFMVDGSPMVGDANLGDNDSPNWRSVLVGTLGLGGRGYFVLDVTDPDNVASATPNSLVLVDRSAPDNTGVNSHIGHIATPPVLDDADENRSTQIVKLNNGRWAVVLGNGVNSASGRAVLLIQYLDAGRELIAIPTNSQTANGMSTPRPIDLDGDGTVDVVYAGDMQGNLWSFDLSARNANEWRVRFNGQPLFVARSATNAVQPITAAPYAIQVPRSQRLQIAFGTGRLLDTADSANTAQQTLYSVRDELSYTRSTSGGLSVSDGSAVSSGRAQLVAQTSGTFSGRLASTSVNPVNYSQRRGWFMDLNQSGERLTRNTEVYQGSVLRFRTSIPSTQQGGESCELAGAQGRFFSTFVNIFSGAPASTSVFALSNTAISRIEDDSEIVFTLKGPAGDLEVQCKDLDCGKDNPNGASVTRLTKAPPTAHTVDWRRLQ